jgi:hypothetical protein
MATLPTPAENARKILDIFGKFEVRPNEGLLLNVLLANAHKFDLKNDDLAKGLEYGIDQGWFGEGQNNFVILTDAGFAEV